MKKTIRGLLALPAVALSVALVAPGAGAATSAQLAPPAHLNADGTVSVPVEYTCDANRTAQVVVTLEQQKGQEYTDGNGYIYPLDCSGTRQVVDVVVRPAWGPFDDGRAVAKLSFDSWVANDWSAPVERVREAEVIRIAN